MAIGTKSTPENDIEYIYIYEFFFFSSAADAADTARMPLVLLGHEIERKYQGIRAEHPRRCNYLSSKVPESHYQDAFHYACKMNEAYSNRLTGCTWPTCADKDTTKQIVDHLVVRRVVPRTIVTSTMTTK